MKTTPLRSILTTGLALALINTSVRAESFPIFGDTAGSITTGKISKATNIARTLTADRTRTVFINFEMSNSGLTSAQVSSARLTLYLRTVTRAGTLSFSTLTSPFNELSTAATQPNPTAANPFTTFNLPTFLGRNFIIIDVTTQVKAWLDDPSSEHGFALASDGTLSVTIASKEGAASGHPAVLEVDLVSSVGVVADGSVTTAKLADGAVTPAKLNLVAGNVGIGTSSPSEKLTVQTGNNSFGLLHTNNSVAVGTYIGNGAGWLGTQSNHPLNFFTNDGSASMTILQDGSVGIGTTTPTKAPLEVQGSVVNSFSGVTVGVVSPNLTGQNIAGGSDNVSIYASNEMAGSAFLAFSDARIKNVQGRSDGAADLATLTGIEITDYLYKDVIIKGARPQKKVIAQQVEKVFPQAVSRGTDVVPDIYRKALVEDGWVQLATDLKVGERVRLIGDEKEGIYEVVEIEDGAFRPASMPAGDEVFVYGREVKDFRVVDYEAIAMLNVSATQELARKLEAKDAEIAALRERLARIETLLDDRPVRTVRASLK